MEHRGLPEFTRGPKTRKTTDTLANPKCIGGSPVLFCLGDFVMPNKRVELPTRVVLEFVRDRQAFFKERNALRRDEIAARQCLALRSFQGSRDKKLCLSDVKTMFLEMKDRT